MSEKWGILMRYQYQNKVELITGINTSLKKFLDAFNKVNEDKKNIKSDNMKYTPHQMLIVTAGWLEEILRWENEESQGTFKRINSGAKWGESIEVYEKYSLKYEGYSLTELLNVIKSLTGSLNDLIFQTNEIEFFEEGKRKWACSTIRCYSASEVIRLRVISTFDTFRYEIQRLGKIV